MSIHDANKARLAPLLAALSSGRADAVRRELQAIFDPDAAIRLGAPFDHVAGPGDLWNRVYAPLFAAMPDMERRDFIVMSGPRWGHGGAGDWVGIGGNIVGTFAAPWLGIPATAAPVYLRYHEYLRFADGRVVEMQGLWDIPQVMIQAGVWPMAPALGVEWMCPPPGDGRGISDRPRDAAASDQAVALVWEMLHDLKQGDAETPERGLGGYWHPHAMWYGPAGLGTARGHAGIAGRIFRQFRSGLSDNTRHLDEGVFFGEGDLVAFTGWPSGTATHSGDGFLGLAPTWRRITRASLDFWRVEAGMIRECWVMVDMIDMYRQLGVDVLARQRVMTSSEGAPA